MVDFYKPREIAMTGYPQKRLCISWGGIPPHVAAIHDPWLMFDLWLDFGGVMF